MIEKDVEYEQSLDYAVTYADDIILQKIMLD